MLPSWARAFTIFGAGILGLLMMLDAITGRGGPGLSLVPAGGPKPSIVRDDRHVSHELLQSDGIVVALKEEPRLKSAEVSQFTDLALPTIEHTEMPSTNVATSLSVSNVEADHIAKVALVTVKAEQARKKRIARERMR